MIQFLQTEIQDRKIVRHKTLHQTTVRDDLVQHHRHLISILNATKQAALLQDIQVQEEIDQLLLLKMEKKKQLQESEKELQMARLEKNRLMKQCDINQVKLHKNREISQQMESQQEALQIDNAKITRQIKQTQLLCERARLQSQHLRQKCQDEINVITAEKFNQECLKNETIAHQKFQQNRQTISKIIDLTQSYHQNYIKLNRSNIKVNSLRAVQLERLLQLQNAQNSMLKGCLKCEEDKNLELSSQLDLKTKAKKTQQIIMSTFDKQEIELSEAVSAEKVKHQELLAKLSQYRRLKKQLQEMYGKLSSHYDTYKQYDLHGIKEMNRHSYRMQRNINQQRHFLKERYSIVDSYRKYLRNN